MGLASLLLLGMMGCGNDTDEKTVGGEKTVQLRDFSNSGCKDHVSSVNKKATNTRALGDSEYMDYQGTSEGYLYVKHVNTIFNCCIEDEDIKMEVTTSGNKIIISENEDLTKYQELCECICNHDLSGEIGPLTEGGKYTIVVKRDNQELVSFPITFEKDLSGKCSITQGVTE